MTHFYGWHPSYPDPRDFPADTSGLSVASEVDPRADMPAPYDQGDLGSCTANAVAGAVEYNSLLEGVDLGTPSRLFIYYGERQIEGTLNKGDVGAMGHDGFKVARNVGVPPETDWPYDTSRYQIQPPGIAYQHASQHKVGAYRHPRLSVDQFKAILSNDQTIAFGFTVYESFESSEVASTGVIPTPSPTRERRLGGHEVLVVGYLADEPNYALVRNSWGPDWGLGGYCLFPWSYLLDPHLAGDHRTIYRPA